jgi:FkbM family methyltransferase
MTTAPAPSPRRLSWTTRTLAAQRARIPFDEAPLGTYDSTAIQRAIIGLARWVGFDNGAVRKYAAILVNALRAAPIDHDYFGLKLRHWPADNSSTRHMLFTPYWTEKPEREFILAHLGSSGTFLDLGANVGLYLFAVAGLRRDCRVLGFEPMPNHAAKARFNIAANRLDRVKLMEIALDNAEGMMRFDTVSMSFVIAMGATEDIIEVRTTPLLPVLREEGITAIDVMKIDIEGVEDRVLLPFFREAEDALWPKAILTERSQGFWASDCLQFMREQGYETVLETRLNVGLVRHAN